MRLLLNRNVDGTASLYCVLCSGASEHIGHERIEGVGTNAANGNRSSPTPRRSRSRGRPRSRWRQRGAVEPDGAGGDREQVERLGAPRVAATEEGHRVTLGPERARRRPAPGRAELRARLLGVLMCCFDSQRIYV